MNFIYNNDCFNVRLFFYQPTLNWKRENLENLRNSNLIIFICCCYCESSIEMSMLWLKFPIFMSLRRFFCAINTIWSEWRIFNKIYIFEIRETISLSFASKIFDGYDAERKLILIQCCKKKKTYMNGLSNAMQRID